MVEVEGKQVCYFCIPSGIYSELHSPSCSNCGRINEDYKEPEKKQEESVLASLIVKPRHKRVKKKE